MLLSLFRLWGVPVLISLHTLDIIPAGVVSGLVHMLCYHQLYGLDLLDVALIFFHSYIYLVSAGFSNVDFVALSIWYYALLLISMFTCHIPN